MKVKVLLWTIFFWISCCSHFKALCQPANKANPVVKISFINTINNIPVVLDSGRYTNCWNENFTVSALKYYISNVQLQTTEKKTVQEKNSYHLVDEEEEVSKSFSFTVLPGKYNTLSFLIGVDSLKNVSGAQTDALDPLNGMFWTWNSGYIMFKLEGNSPNAAVVKNKMEYHIGGFSGVNNVIRKVELHLDSNSVSINKEGSTEIIVQADLGKIWNAITALKISNTPVCTTPGSLAASVADNYSKAFEVVKIVHQ